MTDEAKTADEWVDTAFQLSRACKGILQGQGREMQGGVLSELLAMWLAGHFENGDAFIEELLTEHVDAVRRLLPVCIEDVKDLVRKTGGHA